jgi:hypothetical protein
MSDTLARSRKEAEYIFEMADYHCQRTGQFLFNSLRHEIAEVVRNTLFDPFYKELSLGEIIDWLENHILFDDQGKMIYLFSDNQILWKEEENG